jgi:predicted PurR-regulated permease PerM
MDMPTVRIAPESAQNHAAKDEVEDAGARPGDGAPSAAPPPSEPAWAGALREAPLGLRERYPNAGWIGLGVAAVVAFFYLLAPILTPFALAGVLAYVLHPGVNWLERRGLPRALGSILMVVLCAAAMLGLVLILLPVLEREITAMDEKFPSLVMQANTRLMPLINEWLGVTIQLDASALRTLAMQQVGQQDMVSTLLSRFGSGGLAVLEAFGTLALVPVVLFYLLLDAHQFALRFESAIPRHWHRQTMQFLREIDSVLAQFLRGQLTVMLVLAIYYSSALGIAGFDSALPIGVLTGLLIFIPYVGFALGLILASLVALLQFATWQAELGILAIYGIGQVLEGFFLTPRLVGERIGLHPLVVIFALLAFGHVFGFFGVLVALPSSAVLLVALRHLRQRYQASAFYRGNEDRAPRR